MALEHAILVSLSDRPATGYELARRFDASLGFFWMASHQQIYKVLGRMVRDGWVDGTEVPQDDKPDKKVYGVSDLGREELKRWTAEPTPMEPVRSGVAVKLSGMADRQAIIADVRRRRTEHLRRLSSYEASEPKYFQNPERASPKRLGAWLVLRGGIITERANVEWCDEILAHLVHSDQPE